VASAVAGYLGQQHVCARRAGAAWRRRYRRGACPPPRVKVIKGTKVELAVCQVGAKSRLADVAPTPPSRCVGCGGRSLIIKLGCPPRWEARSASFRGDGWILWEIARPETPTGLSPALVNYLPMQDIGCLALRRPVLPCGRLLK